MHGVNVALPDLVLIRRKWQYVDEHKQIRHKWLGLWLTGGVPLVHFNKDSGVEVSVLPGGQT